MAKGNQGSLADIRIEDTELEADLEILADYDPEPAKLAREAAKRVKEIMSKRHPDAVNKDEDGEHTGYVICGQYRFAAMAADRPEKTVQIKQSAKSLGEWEPLEVQRLDLASAGK